MNIKKSSSRLAALAMIFAMFAGNSFVSKAYIEVPVLDANSFDYQDYAARYPDVAAFCKNNPKALYNHYVNSGYAEGRFVRIPVSAYAKVGFDSVRYAQENPDVVAVLGNNKDALLNHYITAGVNEGREGHSTNSKIDAYLCVYNTIGKIITPEMDDYAKVKAVHDWIINNTRYGFSDNCYSIEGVMHDGLAVCQGYAETFTIFMNALGIENEFVTGTATNSVGESGAHGWNRVKVNGTWYSIDVTWDDPICSNGQDVLEYNYFLISDEQMSRNHFSSTYGNSI